MKRHPSLSVSPNKRGCSVLKETLINMPTDLQLQIPKLSPEKRIVLKQSPSPDRSDLSFDSTVLSGNIIRDIQRSKELPSEAANDATLDEGIDDLIKLIQTPFPSSGPLSVQDSSEPSSVITDYAERTLFDLNWNFIEAYSNVQEVIVAEKEVNDQMFANRYNFMVRHIT